MAEALGGVGGYLQGSVGGLVNYGSSFLDKILPPEQRATLMAKINKFAAEKPALASFLLSHIALSGLPLAIFIIFVVTIAVFAIVVALLLALLVAVLFIVVMAGFALVILFPILFFTTFVAVAVWLWGMAAYYILKWFNKTDIPGIHTDFKGGVSDEVKGALGGLGLGGGEGGLGAITGGGMGTPDAKPQQNGSAQKEPVHSKSSGRDGSENGSAQKLPSRGGGQNPASNVTNKAGDVQKQLGGVTNKAGAAGGALNSAKGQIPGLG